MVAPSVKVIPSQRLYVSEPNPRMFGNGDNEATNPTWTNTNWLKSRFHFSFAEYSNEQNTNFGVMRVMNDDLVQPKRGFGTHPHRDMEIITYIVHGELTHKDTLGTSESLGRGSVQFMTAGSGIMHSEFNEGDRPLRFIQTWVIPKERGLKPNYGSFKASETQKNTFHHLVSNVSDSSVSTPVEINQDTDMWTAELEQDQTVFHHLSAGRQGYLLCIEGTISVNGRSLRKYDACEICGEGEIEVNATSTEMTENGQLAHLILFVMEQLPGSGRSDC